MGQGEMHDPIALLFVACLYFIAPVAFAKTLMGARWRAILIAYAIWYGLLAAFCLSAGARVEEALGWMMILAMFLTIPAVPVVLLLLRLAGVR